MRLATGEFVISYITSQVEAEILDTPMIISVQERGGVSQIGMSLLVPFAAQDSIVVVPGSIAFYFNPEDQFVESYEQTYDKIHGLVHVPEKKILLN